MISHQGIASRAVGEARQPVVRVLFVCTGNICRSPTAEGVFRHLVEIERLQDRVLADSAGTHGYHVGEQPDRRSILTAAARGYDLSEIRARQFSDSDFDDFDYLLAMDRGHRAILNRIASGEHRRKVALFLDYSLSYTGQDVQDPYYGAGRVLNAYSIRSRTVRPDC